MLISITRNSSGAVFGKKYNARLYNSYRGIYGFMFKNWGKKSPYPYIFTL